MEEAMNHLDKALALVEGHGEIEDSIKSARRGVKKHLVSTGELRKEVPVDEFHKSVFDHITKIVNKLYPEGISFYVCPRSEEDSSIVMGLEKISILCLNEEMDSFIITKIAEEGVTPEVAQLAYFIVKFEELHEEFTRCADAPAYVVPAGALSDAEKNTLANSKPSEIENTEEEEAKIELENMARKEGFELDRHMTYSNMMNDFDNLRAAKANPAATDSAPLNDDTATSDENNDPEPTDEVEDATNAAIESDSAPHTDEEINADIQESGETDGE